MKKIYLTLLIAFGMQHISFGQTNNFPTTGNALLYSTNYLQAGTRTFLQHPNNAANNYSRGILSSTLSWNAATSVWSATGGGTYSDFAMLRFENNGVIGFFNRPFVSGDYTMTDVELEDYRKMTIASNGYVGIGVKSPTEKLSVKGKIRAQEIKVDATNWPDYVFVKGYELPPLAETERHIKEKGHLPGIPSAAEVTEKGIELGEMNKKLLQKIEELTLHLIEQNKLIKAQGERILVLEKRSE